MAQVRIQRPHGNGHTPQAASFQGGCAHLTPQDLNKMSDGTLSAKEMITQLMGPVGMTAAEISDALGKRVSRRTVYRWAKGESAPQQSSDLAELERLVEQRALPR